MPIYTKDPNKGIFNKIGNFFSNLNDTNTNYNNSIVGADTDKNLLDKSFNFSVGTSIFDAAMTGIQLAQGLKSDLPQTRKNVAPRLRAPKLVDTTTSAQAQIKDNLATSTNTALAYAKERGVDPVRASTGIFASASKIARDATIALNDRRQDIYSQHEANLSNIDNQNILYQTEAINDYNMRKEQAIREDNARRDMQIGAAVSNFGAIGSKLANDYLFTNVLKSKVDKGLLNNF